MGLFWKWGFSTVATHGWSVVTTHSCWAPDDRAAVSDPTGCGTVKSTLTSISKAKVQLNKTNLAGSEKNSGDLSPLSCCPVRICVCVIDRPHERAIGAAALQTEGDSPVLFISMERKPLSDQGKPGTETQKGQQIEMWREDGAHLHFKNYFAIK